MTLHDWNLANQTPASYRTDHNNLNLAAVSNSASSSGITTTFAHMLFADVSSSGWMRQRNAADSTFNYLWPLGVPGGIFTYSGSPSTNHAAKYQGQPLYDTANDAYYIATLAGTSSQATWAKIQFSSSLNTGFPKGYMQGPPVKYNSAAQVIIQGGFRCRDSSNFADIEFSSNYTIDITVSGAGGLSTDLTEASSQWYYLFAIRKSGDGSINGILTTATSGPVMPSGYDSKRMLPIAIRNSSAGDFYPFRIADGWPDRPVVLYNANRSYMNSGGTVTKGDYNLLENGSGSSYVTITGSSYFPPISRQGLVALHAYTNNAVYANLRQDSVDTYRYSADLNSYTASPPINIPLTSSRQFDYKIEFGSGGLNLDAAGFVVTEVTAT